MVHAALPRRGLAWTQLRVRGQRILPLLTRDAWVPHRRGRRGTDKEEAVEMLTYLVTVAKGAAQKFEVYAQLVSSLFDLNPGMHGHLKTSIWKKCVINLFEMMNILADNPSIRVDEFADASEERTEQPADGVETKVWGNIVAFVERLDDELFKSLQVRVRMHVGGPQRPSRALNPCAHGIGQLACRRRVAAGKQASMQSCATRHGCMHSMRGGRGCVCGMHAVRVSVASMIPD